jgi:hypothetical protein
MSVGIVNRPKNMHTNLVLDFFPRRLLAKLELSRDKSRPIARCAHLLRQLSA